MELKTYLKLFSTISKELLTCFAYVLFLACLFLFPAKSHAYSNSDPIVTFINDRTNGLPESYVRKERLVLHDYLSKAYSISGEDTISIDYFSYTPLKHLLTITKNGQTSSYYTNQYLDRYIISQQYTIQDCFDLDYKILQIPSGHTFEGHYICTPYQGESPTEPTEPDNGIYTPEQFDEFFCGQSVIKDKLSYAYYDHSQVVDYGVRRALSSSAVLSGNPDDDTLNLYICGSDGCTYEQLLEDARSVISFLPEERFFAKQSLAGDYYDFEVFAYCKSAVKQVSTSDLTSDPSVDCRKAIYQYTGESGASLNSPPDTSCYVDDNYDYTFKQWCEAQFDEGSYWLEGQLEEYCDPPAKETSTEKIEKDDECKITTTVIDVGYNTSQVQDTVKKTIIKKIVVTDCTGEVISEEVIETEVDIGKGDIMGDGSDDGSDRPCVVGPYCPPTHGTGEGTGSGIGEGSGSGSGSGNGSGSGSGTDWGEVGEVDDLTGWYVSQYPDGFQGVLNKHIDNYNNGAIGAFISSLNPFGDGGSFPKFTIDLKVADIVDFGKHTIDLERIPIGESRNLNVIALIKALLLIYASIYAFRQVL